MAETTLARFLEELEDLFAPILTAIESDDLAALFAAVGIEVLAALPDGWRTDLKALGDSVSDATRKPPKRSRAGKRAGGGVVEELAGGGDRHRSRAREGSGGVREGQLGRLSPAWRRGSPVRAA